MPFASYRRRTYSSRPSRPYRRRAPYRRRPFVRRKRPFGSQNRIVSSMHRYDSVIPLVVSNTTDQSDHVSWDLGDFPGTGPFQNLYHQYRIKKVKIEFIPCNIQSRYNLSDPTDPAQEFTPTLYTAINRTSTAFANNVGKIMSMNSCKYTIAGRQHKRYFTPASLDQVYESATTTAYAPEYCQWLSTDDPRVPHFGLDYVLAATTSEVGAFKYRIVSTVWVEYRNRKPNTNVAISLPAPLPAVVEEEEETRVA